MKIYITTDTHFDHANMIKYCGRVYANGTVRKPEWGKYLQDFNKIDF